MTASALEAIFSEIKHFSNAMLVTYGTNGMMHARPMVITDIETPSCVWFITASETAKTYEIAKDNRVLVTCQDDDYCYLTLSGIANVVYNRQKVASLWKDFYSQWFPQGPSDPDIALIRVDVDAAEYWDHSGFQKAQEPVSTQQSKAKQNQGSSTNKIETGAS